MSLVTTPAKTHIVIPARFKSTRLPGKPLFEHSWQTDDTLGG